MSTTTSRAAIAAALLAIQSSTPTFDFDTFYRAHGTTVEAWMRRSASGVGVVNHQDLDEVTQEVWARLLSGDAPAYDPAGSVTSYVYWLTKTVANGAKRLRRRDAELALQDGQASLSWGDGKGITPLTSPEASEARMDAEALLDAADADVRNVVELTFWQDQTVREIADQVDCHYATVSRTLKRFYADARVQLAA